MEKVDWRYTGRGGYEDFSYNVAAIELGRTAKRVKIAVLNQRTGIQIKHVTPDRVKAGRTNHVPGLDDVDLQQAQA